MEAPWSSVLYIACVALAVYAIWIGKRGGTNDKIWKGIVLASMMPIILSTNLPGDLGIPSTLRIAYRVLTVIVPFGGFLMIIRGIYETGQASRRDT